MPPLTREQKEKIAAAQNFTTRWIAHFSQTCPELGKIPPGWAYISDKDSKRIYWVNTKNGNITDVNPHLGPLPEGWVLRVVKEMDYPDGTEGMYKARYHDRRTGVFTRDVSNSSFSFLGACFLVSVLVIPIFVASAFSSVPHFPSFLQLSIKIFDLTHAFLARHKGKKSQ